MNFGGLKNGLKATYLENDKAEKELQQSGYTLDKELSGQRAKVYTDANGKPIVAYRGTQNFHDKMTDLAIGLGLGNKTKRVKHSKMVAKQAEDKYGQSVNAIGHSLGGYLAEKSGVKGNIVTFNKASVGAEHHNAHQIDIRTKKDIVSMLTPKNDKNITIRSPTNNLLTEHKTDTLGRVDGNKVIFV